MPIFEYKCADCDAVTEFLVRSATDDEQPVCEKCGGLNLERLLSTPNVSVGSSRSKGSTCCGATERCETPPCAGGSCIRDND